MKVERERKREIFRQIKAPNRCNAGRISRFDHTFLRGLIENGAIGAWYTLEAGATAEVLFCRSTDTEALQAAFAQTPSAKAARATVSIWPQYLGKGVVK